LRRSVSEIESLTWQEVIGWITYDRLECIGSEREEVMLAAICEMVTRANGAHVDIYDFLAISPWNKMERPMPTDEQIMAQIFRNTGRKPKQNG